MQRKAYFSAAMPASQRIVGLFAGVLDAAIEALNEAAVDADAIG